MYKHIFFDLDDTVWDYRANARETLLEIYHEEGLEELDKFEAEEFVTTFTEINYRLWDELDKGIITKKIIREKRFEIVLEALGVLNPVLSRHLNERFIETCPTKSNVPDKAHEILTHLYDSYQMHIITNGFQEVQHIKMKSANLDSYFQEIFISEVVGARKPDPQIFDHALEVTGANREESIMIGDNLHTDIQGAINSDIDQVYFNPLNNEHDFEVTHEIRSFSDLLKIL